MNETVLIIDENKAHKLSIHDSDGNLRLTIRILGLETGINVDLTMGENGDIKVKEYEYAPKTKTVVTTVEEA